MPAKAFSGKQKKEQLKAKRQAKNQASHDAAADRDDDSDGDATGVMTYGGDKQGVRSQFHKESYQELENRRRLAYAPLTHRSFDSPAVPLGSYFTLHRSESDDREAARYIPLSVAVPTRACHVHSSETLRPLQPVDDAPCERDDNNTPGPGVVGARDKNVARSMPSSQCKHDAINIKEENSFEAEERRWFDEWVRRVDRLPSSSSLPPELRPLKTNSYEQNIDVWRQYWRTVELSDVVCVVADVRYPIVHLPLSLVHDVVRVQGKPVVVCLNKADLVPESVVEGWKTFLAAFFKALGIECPIPFVTMTTMPEVDTALGSELLAAHQRRKSKRQDQKHYEEIRGGSKVGGGRTGSGHSTLGAELAQLKLDRAPSESSSSASGDDDEDDDTSFSGENFKGMEKAKSALCRGKRQYEELARVAEMIDGLLRTCKAHAKDQAATKRAVSREGAGASGEETTFIGFVGHPNVGKSSLLNAIRGTKVVSVSATAGHTKHLQTIPIPADGVVLVDCPGLAFPVLGLPRPLQAVIGTHQVAQTRDPQSGVAYLGNRLPLERIYGLKRLDGGAEGDPWSPWDLCEAYALKKGFRIKNGKGQADIHRAAIAMLQEAYQGRLVIYFAPPRVEWLSSPAFVTLKRFLLMTPLLLVSGTCEGDA